MQKAGINFQGSGNRGQESGVRGQGSGVRGQGSGNRDQKDLRHWRGNAGHGGVTCPIGASQFRELGLIVER